MRLYNTVKTLTKQRLPRNCNMKVFGRAIAACVVVMVCIHIARIFSDDDPLYNGKQEGHTKMKPFDLAPPQASPPFAPKNATISLRVALSPNSSTVVYLFHQRKAGGSTLRKYLLDFYSNLHVQPSDARATSYVPCHTQKCTDYDPNPQRQFLGEKRLLAGHLGFTIAAARAVYGEPQVLMTNFREPTSRIVSCVKYRFPKLAQEMFDKPSPATLLDNSTSVARDPVFDVAAAATFFLHRKDKYGDSCSGEPFRMLSPYDPDLPRTDAEIKAVCDFVQRSIHVVDFAAPPVPPNSTDMYDADWTVIEQELAEVGVSNKLNAGKEVKSTNFTDNIKKFQAYIRDLPVVRSELKLYQCLGLPLRRSSRTESLTAPTASCNDTECAPMAEGD